MILRINEAEAKYIRSLIEADLKTLYDLTVDDADRWQSEYQTAKALEDRLITLERVRIKSDTPEAKIIRENTI